MWSSHDASKLVASGRMNNNTVVKSVHSTSQSWTTTGKRDPVRFPVELLCQLSTTTTTTTTRHKLLLTAAPRFQQGFDADLEEAWVLLAGHGCSSLLSVPPTSRCGLPSAAAAAAAERGPVGFACCHLSVTHTTLRWRVPWEHTHTSSTASPLLWCPVLGYQPFLSPSPSPSLPPLSLNISPSLSF